MGFLPFSPDAEVLLDYIPLSSRQPPVPTTEQQLLFMSLSLGAGWDLPFSLPSSKRERAVQADCSCKASTGTAAEDAHAYKHPQTHRSPGHEA